MEIDSGTWQEGVGWSFWIDPNSLPEDNKQCSAAAIVFNKGKVLMSFNNQRDQWEFPGGHRAIGETAPEACVREVFEEGGVRLKNTEYFGYRKITGRGELINPSTHIPYPIESYCMYYHAETAQEPILPLTAEECSDARFLDFDDERISVSDRKIINAVSNLVNEKRRNA